MYYSMEWFGVDLGSIWGSVWGQDRFGVTLGSIWAQFGVHLGDLGVFAQMRKEMWLSWTGFVSARTNNSTPAPGPAPSAIANHTPSAFARRPPSASNADGRAVFNALLKGINPLAVLKSIRLALSGEIFSTFQISVSADFPPKRSCFSRNLVLSGRIRFSQAPKRDHFSQISATSFATLFLCVSFIVSFISVLQPSTSLR